MKRKTKITTITIFIVCTFLILNVPFGFQNNIVSAALDNPSDWNYYKSMIISNSVESYQMKVHLYASSGTDNPSAGIFYTHGHCVNFPNDIRFGSTDNTSSAYQLHQWLQESNDSEAIYWINTSSGNYSTIYMFAGNENATLKSDGFAVFPWIDEYGYYFVNSTATFTDNTLAIQNGSWPYASGTAITKLQNGTLMAMYNGGVAGPNGNYRAYHRYSYDNGTTWTANAYQTLPIGVLGSWHIGITGLTTAINGTVIAATLEWHSRSNSPVYAFCSYDGGMTWDSGENLNIPYVYSGNALPVMVLSNETVLIGASCDTGVPDPGKWGTYFTYSDDNGSNWHQMGLMAKLADKDTDEIAVVQTLNGSLYQRSRTNNAYIYDSWSEDGGWNWCMPSSTGVMSGLAPQAILRVSSDPSRIVYFCHNNSHTDWQARLPLNGTYSIDDCISFKSPQRKAIDKGYATSYPSLVLADDDTVLIHYWNSPDAFGGTKVMKVPVDWFWTPYWEGNVDYVNSTSVYNDGEFTLAGSNKYIESQKKFPMPFVFEMKTKVNNDSVDGGVVGFGDTPGTTSYLPANGCAYVMGATPTISTRVNNVWHSAGAASASLEEYEVRKFVVNTSGIKVYYNDTLDIEVTADLPAGSMGFWYTSKTGSSCNISTEYAFVRQYADPEPIFSSSGGWTPVDTEIQFIDIDGGTNGTIIYTSTPIFNWSKVSNTALYHLQIDNNQDFSSPEVNISDINKINYPSEYDEGAHVTFVIPSAYKLPAYGTYYCRVRAFRI